MSAQPSTHEKSGVDAPLFFCKTDYCGQYFRLVQPGVFSGVGIGVGTGVGAAPLSLKFAHVISLGFRAVSP